MPTPKKRPLVIVTRKLPDPIETRMMELFDTRLNLADKPLSQAELIEAVKTADVLVPTITDRIDGAILAHAGPNFRLIANFGTGVDHIDLAAARQRGITVTNTPGVLTEATADLAWALIMSVCRRVTEGDTFTREGRFRGWAPEMFLGLDVHGRTLGIVGLGRIGLATARRGAGFGMKILYYSRAPRPEAERELGARRVDLDTLLAESDIVSLHTPLTPETTHLIDRRRLGLMKPTAVLVNTARGPVVDEAALVEALRERRIFGAGLDVYEREPELHPGLAGLANTVLLPHLGSGTFETRKRMARIAVENLTAVLEGRAPAHPVFLPGRA